MEDEDVSVENFQMTWQYVILYMQHMFPRRFKRRETQTRTHTLDLVFQGRPTAAKASSRFRPKKK